MWATTKWAFLTWLKLTAALALGCGLVRWLAPGWFLAAVIVAVLVECWAVPKLAREWSFEARLSWWWTR